MSRADPPDPPDARDAWLQAALRHAPDADAAPPAAVRDAILRAARRAPRRVSLRDRIDAAWGWLARPPVTAAFASLLLGSAIVVMWREPPPEAVDPIARVAPAGPSAAPAAPAAPAVLAVPQPQAAPAAPTPERLMPLAKTAPPPAATPRHEAAPAAKPKAAAGENVGIADASAVARSEVRADAGPQAGAEATQTRRTAEAAPARAAAAPALAPFADPPALWAAIAAQPEGWSAQIADGSHPPIAPAGLQAAAAELAARTSWSAATAGAPLPTDVLLQRDGRVLARLRFGAASLDLAITGGRAWQSPVDAETLARLRRAFGG